MSPTKTVAADIRTRNIMAAFRLLFPAARISRSELGRQLGLSRMAANEVTREMLDEHIIREIGEDTRTGRGKRSQVLAIDTAHWRVLSVDLSEPYVLKGAVVDLCGRIVDRTEIPSDDPERADFEDVTALSRQLMDMAGDAPVLGLGLAVPGIVDADGNVIHAVHLGWHDLPARQRLEDALQVPVLVGNATDAALLAERHFGEGSDNSMLIRIGAGVGASLCVNGEIVEGQHYMAGEIGHVVVDPNGPDCACGKRGCVEAYLSTTNLYAQIAADPAARIEILTGAGQMLGRIMAVSLGLLDLGDVALDAPADIAGEAFLNGMRGELSSAMTSHTSHHIPRLHRCQVGSDASLRGQAIAVIHRLVPTIRTRTADGTATH
ncbi:ROK family protein [Bifidobacterium cuniculi]|uniref:NagC/XylR-type transciptional regulator n=1 Tax=Bifidobacterium cuniculi TaxID=1688 RepID=A0A087AZH7_9BIFI|nr:ROK family protein [Bifidobacterium cuniculi]KFI64177.1 NagC/XylR-type transciptional regulator [Bifidobacterium cuniculi]